MVLIDFDNKKYNIFMQAGGNKTVEIAEHYRYCLNQRCCRALLATVRVDQYMKFNESPSQ
jgi:hypothetical protein